MKEVTIITTCEITSVVKIEDDKADNFDCPVDEEMRRKLSAGIKSALNEDDVQVLNCQMFVGPAQEVAK